MPCPYKSNGTHPFSWGRLFPSVSFSCPASCRVIRSVQVVLYIYAGGVILVRYSDEWKIVY